MIKKYGSKIFTSVSFTGIAISNVKAADIKGIQKVHIKLCGDVYHNNGDTPINMTGVKDFNALCNIITSLTAAVKQGDSTGKNFNFSKFYEIFFVKEVKVSGSENNLLSDDFKIDLSAAEGDVEITLVPKRECVKFKYTGKKQLTTANEFELLKLILQGETLGEVKIDGLEKNVNNKLGGIELEDTTKIVGSNDIKLFGDNPCELEIDSTKIMEGNFKTFILQLTEEAGKSLVSGLFLSKFDKLDKNVIIKDNKGTSALTELNKIQVTKNAADKSFFKGKFEILKNGEEAEKVDTENSVAKENFKDGDFYILKDIKKENINAKYLKKTFDVKLDSTDTTKSVVPEKITELINDLKTNFENSLKFSTSDIWTELKKNEIINNTFTGQIKISKGGADSNVNYNDVNDLVDADTTSFVIKLPAEAFATGKTEIKITCDFSSINKDLKEVFKNDVNTTLNKINVATSVTNILNVLNTDLTQYLTGNLDDKDIAIEPTATSGNVNSNSTIKFTESGIAKLKDCFEAPAKPKGGEGSGSSNGDEQKGDDKKGGEKGYSGSGKKNK